MSKEVKCVKLIREVYGFVLDIPVDCHKISICDKIYLVNHLARRPGELTATPAIDVGTDKTPYLIYEGDFVIIDRNLDMIAGSLPHYEITLGLWEQRVGFGIEFFNDLE